MNKYDKMKLVKLHFFMGIDDLKNKLIAVLGFGQEGRAITQYLIKHGIKPVLFDIKPWDQWDTEDQKYITSLNLNFIFGPDCFKELPGFFVAFRSPGIPILNEDIQNCIQNNGLIVTSQTKWFFDHSPAKIIGITGTKGKGTTSSLIYEIVSAAQSKVHITGNIGKMQPLEFIDSLTHDDIVVYELSSFQLQDLHKSPHVGVVLMTTEEHLDYHKDIFEYHAAKESIVSFQNNSDFCIYNNDYEGSRSIASKGGGMKIPVSRFTDLDTGCFVSNDEIFVKNICGTSFSFPISKFQLPGKHNLENICAAAAASVCLGINKDIIISTINSFKGLEHRLEFVGKKNEISFYNDSISTTPESTIAAIESFSSPIILILGGSSKHSNFSHLAEKISTQGNIKAVILIGQEGPHIKQAIVHNNFSGKIFENVDSMNKIFDCISTISKSGDVVLLSPACASFGMFRNYKDRGDQFKAAFNSL